MYNDYFPFGMKMKQRTKYSDHYQFGYNGMRKDNEVSGEGNAYTTEFRQYYPRLGRWLSLDPLMDQFPWMSPFVGMDNNPISLIDPLGLSTIAGDPPADGGVNNGNNEPMYSVKAASKRVVIKEKWWQKVKRSLKKAGKKVSESLKVARRFINESIKVAGLFTLGVANAHASNNLLGAGRGDASKFGKYKDIVQTGQTVGDLISLAQGTTEVITGATGNAVGVLLDATGVGAVVGVPVNVASTAVAVHGTTVVGTATANIIMDYSGGGSGGGGSESSGEDDGTTGGEGGTPEENVGKSINQLNKDVNTGNAPSTIKRFDKGKIKGEKTHVHFKDGNHALNKDGTWKHGGRKLSNKELKYLRKNGWKL
jgi:RHS repeat-associated protein